MKALKSLQRISPLTRFLLLGSVLELYSPDMLALPFQSPILLFGISTRLVLDNCAFATTCF